MEAQQQQILAAAAVVLGQVARHHILQEVVEMEALV
jgi:hypothetical protein